MEVIFLGTGTSQGVPMIAHEAPELDLADRRNWRTRCSIHVKMGETHIQVDAAQEFRLQCIHNDIRHIDHFILTHGHADHVLGMDDLRRFIDLRGYEALPVWSSEAGLERIRQIFPYAIGDRPQVKGYPAFSLREMPAVLDLPGGTIESLMLPHGPVESLGLVFTEKATGHRVAYYTDCKTVTPEAEALAQGAEVVILDALRPEPHPSHMSMDEATAAALRIRGRRTYFTHMTFRIDHQTYSEQLPESVFLAYDGLTVRTD